MTTHVAGPGFRPVCARAPLWVLLTLLAACQSLEPSPSSKLQIEFQDSKLTASLRGLSVVDERVAWASGSGGTVLRTIDGGESWQRLEIPETELLDFRDVEAFDADTAYLMSAGEGTLSRIYKTTDGGRSWELQYRNPHEEGFFDSLAFWDRDHGAVLGDPVGGAFFLMLTRNGGRHWECIPVERMPPALDGEHAFAASGTCLVASGRSELWMITGGAVAQIQYSSERGQRWQNLLYRDDASAESSGLFSLAVFAPGRACAVGGDYQLPEQADSFATVVSVDSRAERRPATPPAGYRSGVAVLHAGRSADPLLVAVGPSGIDLSLDRGRSWEAVSLEGFHAVDFAGRFGWATGAEGRIARLSWR